MKTIKEEIISAQTKLLLKKAEEFHGHFGPFLVLGVRMGLIGLGALDAARHGSSLKISLKVPLHVPYSCVVDGIQTSTKCTLGNQKLELKNEKEIEAKFQDSNHKRDVTVTLIPRVMAMIKGKMVGKNLPEEEICKLAWNVASIPEKDLFVVKDK